jgi:hypothetical protein
MKGEVRGQGPKVGDQLPASNLLGLRMARGEWQVVERPKDEDKDE